LSASLGNVMIAIKAVDEASGVMDKIRASTSILGSAFQSMGGAVGSVGNVMQGFAAGGVAGAAVTAIGEVAKGLKWAIGEASEAEQAIKNLSIAVEKSGTSWESVKEGTNAALSEMQKFTTYSDKQLAAVLQQLLTFGMSYDEAMKALGTTVDLAAAKQIDLGSAATILGKAFMGNTAILARYGIDITTGKEATVAFKDAVDKVGDALSTAQKTGGVLDGFKDSIGDMGVKINDADGKMRDFKDIATDLVSALAEGRIDTKEYGQTLADLGIDVTTLNLKAADFTGVMAELNEKFGGTAQEQAKTYAGTQERLKNAMSDLGEKIGGMVLPALAGMTEAMIPVVDWLGKGVDAVGNWLTEVGKMPEVQGFVSIVQGAFDGLWKGMQDFWGFLSETFGPVLKELGDALGEVFDALAPIGEAFGEVWAAITGGQEGADWLKDFLKFVAQFIREVVVPAIKEAVPVIRGFAEAFKDAADFALPIITGIKDAVVGFIKVLKDAFYGFYTWLVGGSLWQDMWNELLKVASGVGNLLKGILEGAFELWKGVFNIGMDALKTILTTGFGLAFAAVQTVVSGAVSILSGLIGGIQTLIQGATKDWGDLVSAVSTTLGTLRDTISAFWTWTTAYWKANVNDVVVATQIGFGQIQQSVVDSLSGMAKLLGINVQWRTLDDMGNQVRDWTVITKAVWEEAGAWISKSWEGPGTDLLSGWVSILATFHQMTNDYLFRSALRFQSFFVHGVFPAMEAGTKQLTEQWKAMLESLLSKMEETTNTMRSFWDGLVNALIGHSTELWNQLTPLFTTGLDQVNTSWQTAWMQVETIIADIYANIQRRSTVWWSMLQESFTTGLTNITEAWQISWAAILGIAASIWAHIEIRLTAWFAQVATLFTTNLATLLINWQTGWMNIQMSAMDICGQIMAGLTSWYQLIQDTTTGNLALLTGNFQNALSGIYDIFTSTFSGMASSAQSSMSAIVSSVASALAQVRAMAAEMSAAMVGHSIWTGMLDEMQAQTYSALGNIAGAFQGMSLAIPHTIPYAPATTSTPAPAAPTGLAGAAGPLSLTIPVTVQVDSQTVARQVEHRIVSSVSNRSQRRG